jgi:hypothetical protein
MAGWPHPDSGEVHVVLVGHLHKCNLVLEGVANLAAHRQHQGQSDPRVSAWLAWLLDIVHHQYVQMLCMCQQGSRHWKHT